MGKNKEAMKLAGVSSVTESNANQALKKYASAALGEEIDDTLGEAFADGTRYEALLKARAAGAYAKRKKQLRAAASESPAHFHAALSSAFGAVKAAALTSPHAMAAGNERQHFCQLAALFCAEPL